MFVQAVLSIALATTAFAHPAPDASADQTTATLFLGDVIELEYVGSVVEANACTTTYDLKCTQGTISLPNLGSTTCDPQSIASVPQVSKRPNV